MKFKVGDRVKCVASNSSLEYGNVFSFYFLAGFSFYKVTDFCKVNM